MADQSEKTPSRSAADKERSRQQNRPVSGRDAKGGGQKPPSGTKSGGQPKSGSSRPGGKSASGPGRSTQQGAKGRTGGGGGPNSGGRNPAKVARRSPAPFIWGAVALVMVFVLVIVLVTVSGGGNKAAAGSDAQGGYPVTPAPSSIVNAVTTIPASTFDSVGVNAGGQQVTPPTLVNKTPFEYNGKPGIFFYGAEFCPYCAAERWALVASLARFGTFSQLDVTKSNSLDTDPSTATFSFRNMQYTSPYVGFQSVEAANGDRGAFQVPTAQEEAILKAYNVTGFPFFDIANKYEENSPEYNPAVLSGLSWNDIASNIHDPSNPITQVIVASSNYISASICAANGGKPASVCHSPGVEAATKALNSSSG